MQIPINQFEQYIDETILKRGLSYFKKGYVSEPEEITAGVYEAIVAGTEDYTVELKIKNDIVVEYVCSCPFDYGPVCKHVTAVLFFLQQDVLDIKPKAAPIQKSKEKKSPQKVKKKTISNQVNELLDKLSLDELKQFVSENAERNPPFRNIFLACFSSQNSNESKEFYSKQVKSILRAAAGRNRFIDWNHVRKVGIAVSELVESARKQIEAKNFKSAIFICSAVMEEMTEALQFADDSNGDIGGSIDYAFDLLANIAKQKLPDEIRKQLFEYCISAFEKRIYADWDWDIGILQIASEVLSNDEDGKRLIPLLDKLKHSDYEKEKSQCIRLAIIKKTIGEEEAEKFIEENLSNSNFRREAIQNAINRKDFEKAITLSKDGIKQDEKSKPGLAKEWYDWLLKIAIAQKQKEKIIEYARFLFIDNFRHEQDYYKLMKNTVQPENWNAFVEEMVKDISVKNNRMDLYLISKIYIQEEWWKRLLELIQEKPSLNYIEQFEKYLSGNYSVELVQLYEKEIVKYMEINVGRNHYQTACRYMRRMVKLGGRETVEKMVNDFRKQYAQRKALMEELNRI
jgi:hypothetical protein